MTSFKSDGSEHLGALTTKGDPKGKLTQCEVVHHPGADLFVFNSNLTNGDTLALDVKRNRWVGLQIPGPRPFGLSSAYAYDVKRDLIYAIGTHAEVSVLRIAPTALEMQPLAAIVAALEKSR